MSYTDLQMKNASQIAYNKELSELFDAYKKSGGTVPVTIQDLCDMSGKSPAQLFEHQDLSSQDLDAIMSWKMVATHDTNSENGFYGCALDTGNGNLLVAFRGSEGMDDLLNVRHDWVDADLKLLNNTLTKQQAEAEKFLKEIAQSDYIDDYHSFSTTGHSLGGNLAEHAAVMSSKYPQLEGKLDRCVSLDGPGFSDEYIRNNRELIEKVNSRIDHYRWSPVGGLLSALPGVERVRVEIDGDGDFFYWLIGRHSTSSLHFDEDGSLKPAKEDAWDLFTEYLSRGIDRMPAIVGDTLVAVISGVWIASFWFKDQMYDAEGNLTPFGWALVTSAAAVLIMYGPEILAFAATLLCYVVIAVVAIALIEAVIETIEAFIEMVAEAVREFCEWIAEKWEEFKQFLAEAVEKIRDWYRKNFDKGYKYATSHPQVTVDTYKLNGYAQRLEAVNRRLSNLDTRINGLYRNAGLKDLWDLIHSDIMIGYSSRFNKCAQYLYETASDYENAERELQNTL